MLTAQFIKEKALEYGADLVGIGDIRHFEGTHPRAIPAVPARRHLRHRVRIRVPRTLYRVMESKVQFFNYTQLGVKLIDEELSEVFLLKIGRADRERGTRRLSSAQCIQPEDQGRPHHQSGACGHL